MKFIYATYNQYSNSIDITTFNNMLLRIDCNKAEDGLKTTPNSQCALNALAIDNPMEYPVYSLLFECIFGEELTSGIKEEGAESL